jgi:hypothetical protein
MHGVACEENRNRSAQASEAGADDEDLWVMVRRVSTR